MVMTTSDKEKMLWVCWEKPDALPDHEDIVLSFLKPSVEAEWMGKNPDHFISARSRVAGVKQRALDIYINVVSKVGTVSLNGLTLRRALRDEKGVSPWWFHKVACKDCESDPTFNDIVQILTIAHIAREHHCTRLMICGGSYEIAEILQTRFAVSAVKCKKQIPFVFYVFSLLKRLKFAIKFLYEWAWLKQCVRIPQKHVDIFFSGFWDWSVKENATLSRVGSLGNKLEDRYFKTVPEKLQERGVRIGWLVWFYNNFEPGKPRRSVYKVARPLKRHPEIIVAQCFLNLGEVFYSLIRFKPFFIFFRYARSRTFKEIFREDGFNFYALFKKGLYGGFLDGTIPYHELVCLAHEKAARQYQPKKVVTFLNFFPYARAVCAGVKQGCPESVIYDMQHASYSWEDTIGRLDARREFEGFPDRYAIPHADYMCVMGEWGREIFKKGGFPDDRLLLTGSCRYDEVSLIDVNATRSQELKKNVLMIAPLDKKLALEMIDAVHKAFFEEFPDVTLSLRPHPFSDLRRCRGFRFYKDSVQYISGTSLDQDLAQSDIVIFSYSTVAQEAFLRGIPVWQWISAGYNASVFRDINIIPTFSSVKDLISLYKRFRESPEAFMPTVEQRQLIKERCFYAGEGLPSDNIVEVLAPKPKTQEDTLLVVQEVNQS